MDRPRRLIANHNPALAGDRAVHELIGQAGDRLDGEIVVAVPVARLTPRPR